MLYKPYWELLSCILQHLSSNHLFQGTIGDPGMQHIFTAIESFALQTLENRAKACSNLHIVNRDSAFTTTPSMCLESWRVKQNHLNSANLYLVRMVALISTDSAHLRASWQFPTLRKFLASLDRMLTSSGSRKWADTFYTFYSGVWWAASATHLAKDILWQNQLGWF